MKKIEKKSKNFISFICAYLLISGVLIALFCVFAWYNFVNGFKFGWSFLKGITDYFYYNMIFSGGALFGVALLIVYRDIKKKYINNTKNVSWKKIKKDLFFPILCLCLLHIFFLWEFRIGLFIIPLVMDIVISLLIIFNKNLKKMSDSIK